MAAREPALDAGAERTRRAKRRRPLLAVVGSFPGVDRAVRYRWDDTSLRGHTGVRVLADGTLREVEWFRWGVNDWPWCRHEGRPFRDRGGAVDTDRHWLDGPVEYVQSTDGLHGIA